MRTSKMEEHVLVKGTSLAAPPVRMMAIHAWVDHDGSVYHDLYPVLFVQSTARAIFNKWSTNRAEPEATPEALVKAGWFYDRDEVANDILVVDESGHLESVASMELWYGGAFRVVACTWPQSRDKQNLAGHIQSARERAASMENAGLKRVRQEAEKEASGT